MHLLFDLADIAEDLFFFGMKPPEIPPRPFQRAQRKAVARLAAGGDDGGLSPGLGEDVALAVRPSARCTETRDLMWQSIRLVLMGRRLSRLDSALAQRLGSALEKRAQGIFDGYCSLTPRWRLSEWLLGDPPPPPHWEATILHAVSFIDAGARIGGDAGAGLKAAGAAMIEELLTTDAGVRLA